MRFAEARCFLEGLQQVASGGWIARLMEQSGELEVSPRRIRGVQAQQFAAGVDGIGSVSQGLTGLGQVTVGGRD